ncbi:MAG: hypothetical protein AAFP70_11955 [Calditrichota bacterium]
MERKKLSDYIIMFTIGDEVRELFAGEAVIAKAIVPHGVSNSSEEKLICLVTMSPRPVHKK